MTDPKHVQRQEFASESPSTVFTPLPPSFLESLCPLILVSHQMSVMNQSHTEEVEILNAMSHLIQLKVTGHAHLV